MTNTITLKTVQERYTAAITATDNELKSSKTVQLFLDAAVEYAFHNEGRGLNLISDLLNVLQGNRQHHYIKGVQLWLGAYFPITSREMEGKWNVKCKGKKAFDRTDDWQFNLAAQNPFNTMPKKAGTSKEFELLEFLRKQETSILRRVEGGEVDRAEADAVVSAITSAIDNVEMLRACDKYDLVKRG